MKKLLSLTLSLLMLLSLPSCRKEEEPPASSNSDGSQEQTGPSPYSDANTTDRYYLSKVGMTNGFVCGDSFYYSSAKISIVSTPLSEAAKYNAVTEGRLSYVPSFTSLCIDPLCKHSSVECPTMLRDPYGEFLVDATESNGGQPVIYYFRATSEVWDGEEHTLKRVGCEIMRYDVAEGYASRVIYMADQVEKLMSYGDYLYYTTATADDSLEFHAVKKTGGEATTLQLGDGYLMMIGANKQGVYVNDHKGNVYKIDHAGENYELIYTVSEVYSLGDQGQADLGMFVEGEYLYFFADFKAKSFTYYYDENTHDDDIMVDYIDHSIRRVKIDAPSGEGEMVAESVFEDSVYGVYNGVLYYGPFDVKTNLDESEYTVSRYFSKGTIKAVNLTTLETHNVVTDCGFEFDGDDYYINDRCIIGAFYSYRKFDYFPEEGASAILLYDFETGAVFCVEFRPSLLNPKK